MELYERANIAVESVDFVDMTWDQCLASEQPQESESMEEFLARMETIGSGPDMEIDSISPDVSQAFALVVEQQFQESASI